MKGRSTIPQVDSGRLAATVRPNRGPAPAAPSIRLSFPARALWELVWKQHPEAKRLLAGIKRQSLLLSYHLEAARSGCRAHAARQVGINNSFAYKLGHRFLKKGFAGLLRQPRRRNRKHADQVELDFELQTQPARLVNGGLGMLFQVRVVELRMAQTARKAPRSRRNKQAAIQALAGDKNPAPFYNHALPPMQEEAETSFRRTEPKSTISAASGSGSIGADYVLGETPAPAPETGALQIPESKERPSHG